MAFHFDLKFQMENSLFTRFLPAVPCVLKLLRGGISQAKKKRQPSGKEQEEKSVAIFERKKEV